MNFKKSRLGYISVLGIAIALGSGGYCLSLQPLGQELTPLDAANIIPDEAIIAAFVETDLQKWSQIKELGNVDTRAIIENQIENLNAELKAEVTAKLNTKLNIKSENINYEQDIQPWLGGAMFALLPKDSTMDDPDILLVLGIKNRLKAYDFLKQVRAESQEQGIETKYTKYKSDKGFKKYKGVNITEYVDQDDKKTTFAVVDNKLLLAQEKKVIEKAIDTYQGEPSLASTEQNGQMLQQEARKSVGGGTPLKLIEQEARKSVAGSQPDKTIEQEVTPGATLVQLYIPNYGALITKAFKSVDLPLMPRSLSILESIDSTLVSFGVENQGLRLQSVTKFNSDEFSHNYSPSKGKLSKNFPDDTIAMVNAQGIDQFWCEIFTYLKQDQDTREYFDLAKLSLQEMTNLDLEKDIFNWMNGEFAFGIVTSPKSIVPDVDINLSGGIILETSQPEQAKQTVAKLENALKENLLLTPIQNKINDKTVSRLSVDGMEDGLNYGWLDNNKLLLTWGDFAFESISESKELFSLADNRNFQTMTQKLPENSLSFLYIDISLIMAMVNQFPMSELDPEAQKAIAILNSIQSVGSNVTMPDERTSQQDLFIFFKN